MDTLITTSSSSSSIISRHPPIHPNRPSNSFIPSRRTTSLFPNFNAQIKLNRSFRNSYSLKLKVKCGGVTEINESQFSDVVLKSDRPVLVEFVAGWCGPCRLVAPAIESLSKEYAEKLLVVKIDHDANPKLIEEYKVYGLPALIMFKDGKEIAESRREGAITKAKLKDYIDTLLQSVSVS